MQHTTFYAFDRVARHMAAGLAFVGERAIAVPADFLKPATAPRRSLLDRLSGLMARAEQKDLEDYLAQSTDRFDLERRLRAWERSGFRAR
jgi:hypothetical protein